MNMPRLYNIHTHRLPVNETGLLSIQSLYDNFYEMQTGYCYSIGLHPAFLENHETQFHTVEKLARQPEVVAIGECGLDKLVHATMAVQTQVLVKHIQLANDLCKPLIIHCVQAHEE